MARLVPVKEQAPDSVAGGYYIGSTCVLGKTPNHNGEKRNYPLVPFLSITDHGILKHEHLLLERYDTKSWKATVLSDNLTEFNGVEVETNESVLITHGTSIKIGYPCLEQWKFLFLVDEVKCNEHTIAYLEAALEKREKALASKHTMLRNHEKAIANVYTFLCKRKNDSHE